jgi:hypothetical protein
MIKPEANFPIADHPPSGLRKLQSSERTLGTFRRSRIVLVTAILGLWIFLVDVEIPRNDDFTAVPGQHFLQELFGR